MKFVGIHPRKQIANQGEERGHRPGPEIHFGIHAIGQHPRQVLRESAAGDVGERLHSRPVGIIEQRGDHVEIGAVRFEQGVTERTVEAEGHRVHREPAEQAPQQRVAVGVRPG